MLPGAGSCGFWQVRIRGQVAVAHKILVVQYELLHRISRPASLERAGRFFMLQRYLDSNRLI